MVNFVHNGLRCICWLICCFSMVSCNQKDSESQNDNICDSLFSVAVDLINKDSITILNDLRAPRLTNFNNGKEELYPILDQYHYSLDVQSIVRHQLDSIFGIQVIQLYEKAEKKINHECFIKYNFISKDSVEGWRRLFESDQNENPFLYYSFSKPLVSENGNYMLIELRENCYGLCGHRYLYLFRKRDKDWAVLRKIKTWVY